MWQQQLNNGLPNNYSQQLIDYFFNNGQPPLLPQQTWLYSPPINNPWLYGNAYPSPYQYYAPTIGMPPLLPTPFNPPLPPTLPSMPLPPPPPPRTQELTPPPPKILKRRKEHWKNTFQSGVASPWLPNYSKEIPRAKPISNPSTIRRTSLETRFTPENSKTSTVKYHSHKMPNYSSRKINKSKVKPPPPRWNPTPTTSIKSPVPVITLERDCWAEFVKELGGLEHCINDQPLAFQDEREFLAKQSRLIRKLINLAIDGINEGSEENKSRKSCYQVYRPVHYLEALSSSIRLKIKKQIAKVAACKAYLWIYFGFIQHSKMNLITWELHLRNVKFIFEEIAMSDIKKTLKVNKEIVVLRQHLTQCVNHAQWTFFDLDCILLLKIPITNWLIRSAQPPCQTFEDYYPCKDFKEIGALKFKHSQPISSNLKVDSKRAVYIRREKLLKALIEARAKYTPILKKYPLLQDCIKEKIVSIVTKDFLECEEIIEIPATPIQVKQEVEIEVLEVYSVEDDTPNEVTLFSKAPHNFRLPVTQDPNSVNFMTKSILPSKRPLCPINENTLSLETPITNHSPEEPGSLDKNTEKSKDSLLTHNENQNYEEELEPNIPKDAIEVILTATTTNAEYVSHCNAPTFITQGLRKINGLCNIVIFHTKAYVEEEELMDV